MKYFVFISVVVVGWIVFLAPQAEAKEYTVTIPFGAFDPSFDTPTDNWYEPPVVSIQKGDSVTWINSDREGHTITSGQGPGRFGWMGADKFGEADGFFESGRFMESESWSYTFDQTGLFNYFCTIHPWMEGLVFVGESIPAYPHDATGNKIDKFPVIEYTADDLIELDMTWEPNVPLTHEKVSFIYQTYDPRTNSNLDKMKYDFIIIQNGKEIFRDEGLTGIGGDYRNFIFDEAGPIEIRFENIESGGTSGIESAARASMNIPSLRTIVFSTMVYDNPEMVSHQDMVIQPAKRLELQYELLVAIIVIPGGLTIFVVLYMMYGKKLPKENNVHKT